MITIRVAETDADFAAWRHVRLQVMPHERAWTVEEMRKDARPEKLYVVAELEGELAGSGLGDRSDAGRGFVAPRVLPSKRRRGVGTALLRRLGDHVQALGLKEASAMIDGRDRDCLAFAHRFGFTQIGRDFEQAREIADEPAPTPSPNGVEIVSIADQPELLRAAYPLACQGYADMPLAGGPPTVSLEQWLREEATLPDASFVALAHGEIVGYAGLMAWADDPTRAEHGLTVVHRDWRRRGLAAVLKSRQIAWAAATGVRQLVTWTQEGNENMRRVNERLGYVTRGETFRVVAPLPLVFSVALPGADTRSHKP